MCGLFGWVGRNPKTFNLDKLNILGVLNEERGRHSCGLAIDGLIKVGVKANKEYRDFAIDMAGTIPESHSVVIGHTRHATSGVHDMRNAHPFGFGTTSENYFKISNTIYFLFNFLKL